PELIECVLICQMEFECPIELASGLQMTFALANHFLHLESICQSENMGNSRIGNWMEKEDKVKKVNQLL
ncbi:hypothetical protein PMAYCL1PPCAC_25570, partial [Pristionchus mayeri]